MPAVSRTLILSVTRLTRIAMTLQEAETSTTEKMDDQTRYL